MVTHLHDAGYWKDFFNVKRCGSGGEQEVVGHVTALINFNSIIKTECLPDMISRYPFEFHDAGPLKKDMSFVSGIFYSCVDEQNILVPEYHCNILWKNMDRCKCSDSDIESIKTLLDFTKRIGKYDDEYYGLSKRHVIYKRPSDNKLWFNYSEYVRNCRLINIEPFEQYMKKHGQYDYFGGPSTPEERLNKLKKAYKKELALMKTHNNVVGKVRTYMQQNNIKDEEFPSNNEEKMTTTQKLYLRFMNEDRESRVKLEKQKEDGKYCFWLRDHLSVKDSGYGSIYSRDFPVISLDELKQLYELQKNDIKLVVEQFDVIYKYIETTEFSFFKKGLFRM